VSRASIAIPVVIPVPDAQRDAEGPEAAGHPIDLTGGAAAIAGDPEPIPGDTTVDLVVDDADMAMIRAAVQPDPADPLGAHGPVDEAADEAVDRP